MERRRRLTSLRSVLLRYLCLCGGGCVLLLMIWWGIFMQLIDNGFLLSATASAQACAEARETVASMTADTFDPSAISSLCRYAVVCDANTDAERVTTTNMSAAVYGQAARICQRVQPAGGQARRHAGRPGPIPAPFL